MRNGKALRMAVASVPLLAMLALTGSSYGASVYWDINGAGTGAGDNDTPSGTWDAATTASWSTDLDGGAASQNYTAAGGGASNDAVFAAGTNATGTYAITVGENVNAHGLVFEEGTVSLSGTPTIGVKAGGITVQAGSGPVTIGNVSGGTKIQSQYSQTWANYSSSKLTIGGGLFAYNVGQIVTLAAGDIQLGNDGTNNTYASTAGIGTFKVDGARLIWSFSSSGIGSNSLTFKSGSLSNSSAKGLGKPFRLEGDFKFENKGNAWRDVTLGGGDGFNPTITVDATGTTGFNGYKLIGTGANQSLTINALATRTVNVGFLADPTAPGLILDGAGTYSLASASTMAGSLTLKNGTYNLASDTVLTSGAITSSPLGVGTVKLVGGSISAVTSNRLLSNNLELSGNVAFTGTNKVTFDVVNSLATANSIRLTGNAGVNNAGPVAFVGAIGEDAAGRTFTKTGAGSVTFGAGEAAANTYTGMTTVSAGELGLAKAANVVAIPGDLAIAGGSVKLYADEQIADFANVSLASTLDLGGFTETFGGLTVDSSTASLLGSSHLTVSSLTVDGTNQATGNYTNNEFSWIASGATISVVAVPEPGALGLLLTGGLLAIRRRRA